VADVEIRAMVPVNLRSEKHAGKLGNRFGMVTLLLPIYEANPFARLFELRKRMLAMKGSYQPPLTMVLLGISGVAPKIVQEKFLDMLANKASAVMTNVPGPQQPLYLAGSRIDQIMFWVPQSGDIGVGVSILSYNDSVQFGLITDRHFIPDPETLTPLFQAEFDKMMMAMMLHDDWNQPVDPVKFEQDLADDLAVDLPSEKVRKSALAGRRPTPKKPAAEVATSAARIPKRFRGL
jgi:diacylglycerol O-acyltransferase